MEIFCRPIYVFLCVTLTFWGGRAPSWGRCWWRSDCGSGRCASRTPGSPDPGSTSTAAVDSAGPETRQQSYLSLFGLELDRNLSLSKINQTPIFLWFELKSSILHDI